MAMPNTIRLAIDATKIPDVELAERVYRLVEDVPEPAWADLHGLLQEAFERWAPDVQFAIDRRWIIEGDGDDAAEALEDFLGRLGERHAARMAARAGA